jgi:hypothetical protein
MAEMYYMNHDRAERLEEEIRTRVAQAGRGPEPSTPGGASVADELTKLAELRDAGVLTSEEFDVQKARLLGS